jgi:hypothetical protein
MKSRKESQLAAITFLRALKENTTEDLGGVFIPFSTLELYKRKHLLMTGIATFGFLSIYILYNALYIDAIYYWHIDLPVILGFLWISIYFLIFFRLLHNFWTNNKVLKKILTNPDESPYGVLITDDYYFENNIGIYHIIPRDNILRIDYEETRKSNIYLELLIDIGDNLEVQGITYKKEEFDMKEWINRKSREKE